MTVNGKIKKEHLKNPSDVHDFGHFVSSSNATLFIRLVHVQC